MFAKVFEKILDSSIADDFMLRHIFEDLLKLADKEGFVDRTISSIARRINVPINIVDEKIKILEQPDPNSRNQNDDGRRILRLDDHRDWGWQIINFAAYRNIHNTEEVRAATRERVSRYREKQKDFKNQQTCNDKALHVTKCNDKQKQKQKQIQNNNLVPQETGLVERIFSFWQEHLNHPKSKLDKKRRNTIQSRLDEKYEIERIMDAVRGCKICPHNRGENDRGTVYDDIDLICRSGANVDRFADIYEVHKQKEMARKRLEDENKAMLAHLIGPQNNAIVPEDQEKINAARRIAKEALNKKWGGSHQGEQI